MALSNWLPFSTPAPQPERPSVREVIPTDDALDDVVVYDSVCDDSDDSVEDENFVTVPKQKIEMVNSNPASLRFIAIEPSVIQENGDDASKFIAAFLSSSGCLQSQEGILIHPDGKLQWGPPLFVAEPKLIFGKQSIETYKTLEETTNKLSSLPLGEWKVKHHTTDRSGADITIMGITATDGGRPVDDTYIRFSLVERISDDQVRVWSIVEVCIR